MQPSLTEGDRVLVLRYFPIWFLRISQIVVLDLSKAIAIPNPKPTIVIKRLVGLPRDIVRLPASQVDQDVLYATISNLSEDGYYEMQVPPAHMIVLADGQGSDSRHWGPVSFQAIVGIVIKRMSKPDVRNHEK